MSQPTVPGNADETTASGDYRREQVRVAIEHAAHLLPVQGPIGVFIHHNTLHAFQHLPFEEAVVEASRVFGTEPFLAETEYQKQRHRGRILEEDIDWVLNAEVGAEVLPGNLTRRELRRAMLIPGVRHFSAANIEWQIDECGLLERLRSDLSDESRQALLASNAEGSEAAVAHELLAICFQGLPLDPNLEPATASRPRDTIRVWSGIDTDQAIHPWLIRLAAVFVDQGLSYWPMPERHLGFYGATRELMRLPGLLEPDLLTGLRAAFARQAAAGCSPIDVVLGYLDRFNVPTEGWKDVITAELLALPGWAGLFRRLEKEPDLAPYEGLPCSLTDFLAVRLTFSEVAATNALKRIEALEKKGDADIFPSWRSLPPSPARSEAEHLAVAAHLLDVAQLLGLSPERLRSLTTVEFAHFAGEVLQFHEMERRRVLHLAYERRHEQLILQPLRSHRQGLRLERKRDRPAAQVIFCIDEREESIRRALEEIDPEVETESAAGFYGVAVNYKGLDDAHGVALCPVVVTPKHAVLERPLSVDADLDARRQVRRRLWADVARGTLIGSRTLIRGWVGTAGVGLISLVPLLTRVLAPRAHARLHDWLAERLLPEPRTELTLMRQGEEAHHVTDGLLLGFDVDEKADRVASVLGPAGLERDLARIVVVLGHGSTSLNNPHESAHDCGACGGRRGGPNARLFAAMANRPEVRKKLEDREIFIPPDTWFVGGYHDTCNDDIEYFDTAEIPFTHTRDFDRIRRSLDRARAASALERSRRFEAAWKDETPELALMHVQERAEHLAEPRPEYGHCTNAVAVVGRRAITRGLFFDRRAFLISYDPDLDPENDRLLALLAAGGPVCAGINLEYYFSFVDNERYGCGTKLPHNVTGLVGVMDGHASDLRTGLPWQMVEIHEPVRLLLIVETTPERLQSAAARNAGVSELVHNRWMRVATIDPDSGEIHVYRDGRFEPLDGPLESLPCAQTSYDWYQGKLDHLPIARIGSELAGAR